jgi:hypothetical protein
MIQEKISPKVIEMKRQGEQEGEKEKQEIQQQQQSSAAAVERHYTRRDLEMLERISIS